MAMNSPEFQDPQNTQGQPKDANEMQFADPDWKPQQQAGQTSRRNFLKIAAGTAIGGFVAGSVGYGIYRLVEETSALFNDLEAEREKNINALKSLFQKELMQPIQVTVVDNKIWTPDTTHATVTKPDASGVGNVGLTIVTDKPYTPPSSYEASNFIDLAYFTLPDGSFFDPAYYNNDNRGIYFLHGRIAQIAPLNRVAPHSQVTHANANLAVVQTDMGGVVEGQFPQVESGGYTIYLTRQPSVQGGQFTIQQDVTPLAIFKLNVPQSASPSLIAARPPRTAQ